MPRELEYCSSNESRIFGECREMEVTKTVICQDRERDVRCDPKCYESDDGEDGGDGDGGGGGGEDNE